MRELGDASLGRRGRTCLEGLLQALAGCGSGGAVGGNPGRLIWIDLWYEGKVSGKTGNELLIPGTKDWDTELIHRILWPHDAAEVLNLRIPAR